MFVLVSTVIVAQVFTSLLGSSHRKDAFPIHTPPVIQDNSKSVKHKLENDEKCGITTGGQV